MILGESDVIIRYRINVVLLKHPETIPLQPSPWKTCISWNQPLMSKTLGTTDLEGPAWAYIPSLSSSARGWQREAMQLLWVKLRPKLSRPRETHGNILEGDAAKDSWKLPHTEVQPGWCWSDGANVLAPPERRASGQAQLSEQPPTHLGSQCRQQKLPNLTKVYKLLLEGSTNSQIKFMMP